MKLLLTAFDPFGGEKINPALEDVKRVQEKIGDLEIFKIEGLEPRMTEIRSEIQPVFSEIGQKLLTELSVKKFFIR